ncbi:hypothetical protein DPMN_114987 [Dreissena polymorpha]|uniref:Uncharacterized protein n=1 Tax=Dreissena polymorpha TaxID=45954 RepID=A0A9D4KKF0_DREPO|nr:hypothetical protein DPMN_114987 [Dreissena polymorpha]
MDVSDVNQPGTYQHTVGQPYVTFTNWAPNLPGMLTPSYFDAFVVPKKIFLYPHKRSLGGIQE